VERILQLRQQYPSWGKDKLAVLLKREGHRLSASSVGRVLNRLKKRGVLVEPLNVRLARAARKRRWKPRYAVRKPLGWPVHGPGDLVQLDTIQIKLRNGMIRWHFSARDVICRWDRARAYSRPTSFAASLFLEYLERKFPFPIRAIQIDGGSEFKKHFEEACQRQKVKLFIIPVRSPKLQGRVERSNRTHREEFYEVEDIGLTLEELNRQLERWTDTYNTIRPHQSLDYQTPCEYYQRWLKEHKAKASLM
jgi:putative transposase